MLKCECPCTFALSFEATCMFGLLREALMTCTSFSPSTCVMLDCTRAVQLACGG